jgi:uncharacterized membrane protein
MEYILILIAILIFVNLLRLNAQQKRMAEQNEHLFRHIKTILQKLTDAEQKQASMMTTGSIQEDTDRLTTAPLHAKPLINEPTSSQDDTAATQAVIDWLAKDAAVTPPTFSNPVENISDATAETIIVEAPIAHANTRVDKDATNDTQGWWQRWMANNPDIEKFIGENLANKIGIAILVLGIGFFVKYAIDRNWINETGRVAIGLGCGICLIAVAHYLRNSYRSFSSVLAGGAIAVFYFTISFAFHEYGLFSQQAAFIIMVVITVFAVALSLLYNKLELAVIAVAGGFIAPFLVSNGSGNYIVLFTYLVVLNLGILSISYFKKWPLLHIQAFFFTQVIFYTWLVKRFIFSETGFPVAHAFLFATCFYLLFVAIVLIYHIRHQRPFKAIDYSLLLIINVCYYSCGIIILSEWQQGNFKGLFTLLMSVGNLALAWWLYKKQQQDKPLLYLLIGLTLTFLSLAAPIQLSGGHITIFWAAETTLLYWLFIKSSIKIFRLSSFAVLVLMAISLLMDFSNANNSSNGIIPLFFDKWTGSIHLLVVIVSMAGYVKLLFSTWPNVYLMDVKASVAGFVLAAVTVVLIVIFGIGLINLYYRQAQSFDVPNVYHQLYVYAIAIGIFWTNRRFEWIKHNYFENALVTGCFLFYMCSTQCVIALANGEVMGSYHTKHVWMFAAATLLMLYLLYQMAQKFRQQVGKLNSGWVWVINFMFLFVISLLLRVVYVNSLALPATMPMYITQYKRAGFTIVWAVYAFITIWLGMRFKSRLLRIVSLSVFTIALIKLFVFDIQKISAGGKIAAFIMLGILLLIVSFMYQRLKKIITDNEENTP